MRAIKGNNWRYVAVRLLAKRDGWQCHYCGVDMERWFTDKVETIHVDHKNPLVTDRLDPDNLVLSCAACNEDKRNIPYRQFLARVMLRQAVNATAGMSDEQLTDAVCYAFRYAVEKTWGIKWAEADRL